jgi:hypothetical protein
MYAHRIVFWGYYYSQALGFKSRNWLYRREVLLDFKKEKFVNNFVNIEKSEYRNKLLSSTFIDAKDPNWVLEWTTIKQVGNENFRFFYLEKKKDNELFQGRSGALLQ